MKQYWMILCMAFVLCIAGCSRNSEEGNMDALSNNTPARTQAVQPTEEIAELTDGLSAVRFDGDYGFDSFLAQGGAETDRAVVSFLTENLLSGIELDWKDILFGCSTISAPAAESNGWLFGRNFDWNQCNALIVSAKPENGYASVSTVNMDFITSGTGLKLSRLPDEIQAIAALYAPLDGMNEQGLCVSVNMIEDSAKIEQDTDKPDLTTTTAIRLLLDKAATTDEALELLKSYDLHGSMGMMIHFAIADANGKSVAVEYIDNEMVVIETPVLTNFYLAEGEKNGIGTQQSHERYEILTDALSQTPSMTAEDMKNALDSVSKDNFNEFESTEWSIVYEQGEKIATYYHRENYTEGYTFHVE